MFEAMQTPPHPLSAFLRAVGLEQAPLVQRPRPKRTVAPPPCPVGVPNISAIAASTEKGILALEEDARGLEESTYQEALELIALWVQRLHRRQRSDEPLASFKVVFVRSNAPERSLQALARNVPLRRSLLTGAPPPDRPDLNTENDLHAQVRAMLRSCFPRGGALLVTPVLRAALSDTSEEVAAALTAVRLLKEDWTEVVQSQAIRGLEQQRDAYAYELQKQIPHRQLEGSADPHALASVQQTSRGHVGILTSLCVAMVDLLRQLEARASLQKAGLCALSDLKDVQASPTIGVQSPPTAGAIHWDLDEQEKCGDSDVPSHSRCESAVAMMVRKTVPSMQEGLQLLGLPNSPLSFSPGVELKLKGHDIREEINTLLACWVEEDKGKFYEALENIRRTVEHEVPDDSDVAPPASHHDPADVESTVTVLLAERSALDAQRRSVLDQLNDLNARIMSVDQRLAQVQLSDSPVSKDLTPRDAGTSVFSWEATTPSDFSPSTSTGHDMHIVLGAERETIWQSDQSMKEFAYLAASAADAIAMDSQRGIERLGTQLQLRRIQLLTYLAVHLEGEQEFVSALASLGTATESIEASWATTQEMCLRAGAAVSTEDIRPNLHGRRCRAKWADGNYYDAEIQGVMTDGSVAMNWLRPRAEGTEAGPSPASLVTVSESGGDDTSHRFVLYDDIDFAVSAADETAREFFEAREAEDLACADCGTDKTGWASVSFGTYLCPSCANAHRSLGIRWSLVRRLADGWNWRQTELQFLRVGGNAALASQLQNFSDVQKLSHAEKYTSRFAEYYRRRLDAFCAKTPPPQPPPLESAATFSSGEFLSGVEALALAEDAAQRFGVSVTAVRTKLPIRAVASTGSLDG